MRKEEIICKKARRTFEEYDNMAVVITLILAIVVISLDGIYNGLTNNFYYPLWVNVVLYASMVISLTIGVLYYNWAQSWNYSTVVTRDGIYTSRKDMQTVYEKAYRKGYFIPWSEISRLVIEKVEPSAWVCTFTTRHGDTIRISTDQKYDDDCFSKLIGLAEGLKKHGVKVYVSSESVVQGVVNR